MALDEALNESVRAGGLPFLRFYQWEPTLSLGRFQNLTTGLGPGAGSVPRVRRPTGGGAIWHADELTYSLGCLQSDLPVTGVKASFELLCGFLLDTWTDLGWDAAFAKDRRLDGAPLGAFTPACFAGQEEYDILVGGKKLGGNAQRRDRTSIFQHGSLPGRLDRAQLARIFRPEDLPSPASTTDLEACGWTQPPRALVDRLIPAFLARLGAEGRPGSPTDAEAARARSLVEERYGNPGWTETGGGSLRPL